MAFCFEQVLDKLDKATKGFDAVNKLRTAYEGSWQRCFGPVVHLVKVALLEECVRRQLHIKLAAIVVWLQQDAAMKL